METIMPHVITSLCVREAGCATVCPVECIVPGNPQEQYPWFYIDPDTCIDCGACVSECPFNAIFPRDEVPASYKARGGEYVSMPVGTPGYSEIFDGLTCDNAPIHLEAAHCLVAAEIVDLSPAIQANADYFSNGPGYEG
jgi:ferredoxin